MRTQVGIVGAGPAGLMLAQLLQLQGIESVVLEARSREHVEQRIRAGVLEQGTVDLLDEAGVGERMRREGLVHHGIELQFDGERHRIPLTRARRRPHDHRLRPDGGRQGPDRGAARERRAAALRGRRRERARPRGRAAARSASSTRASTRELECDFIAGCDGFHGVCRASIPDGRAAHATSASTRSAGSASWPPSPPSCDELIYAHHERGFALHSLRSPELSRLYLQCRPDEDIAEWPDARIWEELQIRLGARRLDAARRARCSRRA